MATPTFDLAMLLKLASHALETELTASLNDLGISPRHYCVLAKASEADLTQSQLAELASLDKTTMVVTVDELERAGYAERRPSDTDRRARIIAVTPAGKQVVAKGRKIVDGVFDDVLGTLPATVREPFVDGLSRLVDDRLSTPVPTERPVRRRSVRK
ncbi:MAG TPA: MarR family transcriptional regulator [Acidimicrobiales bacterium]|jgi:DNA-binding MarR family transcriptional regulator